MGSIPNKWLLLLFPLDGFPTTQNHQQVDVHTLVNLSLLSEMLVPFVRLLTKEKSKTSSVVNITESLQDQGEVHSLMNVI